ncbi:TolC family protein [Cognatilysobacter terrigena]|uniref:TolC family protein n=1 Tax=Cognatilysobacter terrigena TaxID=2488749 RepID=UPI001FE796D7|nr:TolC family protein [Lysobacter terrigena]
MTSSDTRLQAARGGSLRLEQAITMALSRAPLLSARQARVEAARQEAGRAGQLPDPELMLGIDNLPITGPDALDFSADEMTQKRIGLRQVLPARAKRAAARAVAARRVDEAVANSAAQAIEVRRATAQAWIDAWAAARELHALGLLREQAQLASRIATARVSTGAQSPSDALATQAEILELDNRIAGVEADRSAALADLSRWTGVELAPTADDAPDFGSLPLPAAQLLASVDRLGPVLQSNALVETAAAEVDAARAEKRPDWSVAAAFAQRDGGRSDMVMLEVGVGLPLFPRNRQNRGITARQAEYEATVEEREDLRRQLSAKIRADLARWQGLKRQVAIHVDSLLPLARDRSAVALAGYRAGGDLQPWIDARRAEIEAHLSHAEHLAELGQAWAALAFLLPEEGAR